MDEGALIPTMLYVLLTVLLVAWAIRSFQWLRPSGVTVTLLALVLLFESGVAYEGVRKRIRY